MSKLPTISPVSLQASMDAASQAKTKKQAEAMGKQGVKDAKELEKATGGFEALLLHQMLTAMWSTVEETGFLGEDNNQSQIYRSMLNQAIADEVSEGKGIGVKDFLKKEIAKVKPAS